MKFTVGLPRRPASHHHSDLPNEEDVSSIRQEGRMNLAEVVENITTELGINTQDNDDNLTVMVSFNPMNGAVVINLLKLGPQRSGLSSDRFKNNFSSSLACNSYLYKEYERLQADLINACKKTTMSVQQTKRYISNWQCQQKAANPLRILFKGLAAEP